VGGQCRLGSQVRLGYFDQHHGNLDTRNNVFQQIQAVSPPLATKQDILGFLAKFQFRGDDVEKLVSVLSGGERARLSVATLIRQGCNLLLMDEPTNHMDIQSMEAMEDTLLAFEGAVVLVTHDRYLLGRVADCLLRIHENRGEFRDGGYEDNQAWVDLNPDEERVEADVAPITAKTKQITKLNTKSEPKTEARAITKFGAKSGTKSDAKPQPIDKEQQKLARRLEKQLLDVEAKISDLEAGIARSNEILGQMDPSDWKGFQDKMQEMKKSEEELMYAMRDWEELQMELDTNLSSVKRKPV
jgi:ATP-binding cassette subfamily F protein 3